MGCGDGKYLRRLSKIGFKSLTGIDPFLNEDIYYPDGVNIYKRFIEQDPDKYDVILSYNSFEHIPNPLESAVSMKEHLNENGVILINIPTLGECYQMYGKYDYVIQAPQHPFLHTVKSMEVITEIAELTLEKVFFDSPDNLRIAWMMYSELYSRGVRHHEITGDIKKYFNKAQMKQLYIKLKESKENGNMGDNVLFVLRNN